MKLSLPSIGSAALLSLSAIVGTSDAAEVILYDSLDDGINANSGASLITGRSLSNYCSDPDTPTSQLSLWGYDAVLQLCVDPWMGGGLKTWKGGGNPDATAYSHVTFMARAEYSTCMPKFSMTCGWWPRYNTNAVELSGAYVAGGSLVADEWRQVIIPTSDLLTGSGSCETTLGIYSVNFGKCNPPPKYWVTDIRFTDSPPSFGSISPTDPPTLEPTPVPTPYSPLVMWNEVKDDPDGTCLDARNNSTQVSSNVEDYLQLITDPWMGATMRIDSHCFFRDVDKAANPTYNHFTDPDLSLVFQLKAQGSFDSGLCDPVISMKGGSWASGGWTGTSNAVKIEHDVIDYGEVSSTEYRQVAIPMSRFSEGTGWDLTSVRWITVHFCPELGMHGGEQPKYYINNMQVTKRPPELVTPYPTSSPTVRVTENPSLATHREIHHHWYPLLDDSRDSSIWLNAANNQWPTIPPEADDHEYTVHVPMGSVVTYSASSSIKLDKVVVHGTLNIQPDVADVLLTCGTLVIEMMGALNIVTNQDGHKVTIEIDGALDTDTDPEQTMIGLVNLGGTTTISGDHKVKMAPLQAAVAAGSTSVILDDPFGTIAGSWMVGDEIVLPDTKEGRDINYWNFALQVPGETETFVITGLTTAGPQLHVTLNSPTQYAHLWGCHAAHISRSITIKTSSTSTDRGHAMHTGMGKFDVSNARFQDLGRTSIIEHDNTVLEDTGLEFAEGIAQLQATHIGTNQIARYALHSHHSMVKVHWSGNAIIDSPRNCMVIHNSFGDITDSVAIGCNGTAIFLESGTESGIVEDNFLIGTGGGTRGHDDERFATSGAIDMAHGGFGIWGRGMLAPITLNRAEGIFGRAPYALFVHPGGSQDNVVPTVEGTNPALAGKTLKQIFYKNPVQLESYGGFEGNTAFGSWRAALDLSYFSKPGVGAGHVIRDYSFTALASSGQGIFMVHSHSFDLVNGNYKAAWPDNAIIGEFCNNGDPGAVVYNNNTIFDGFALTENYPRGGNC